MFPGLSPRQVFQLGILRKLVGHCLTMVRPGPSRRFGELRVVWAYGCDGGRSHWIIHLHSNTPSRQQLNQTTNHTNKKKISQVSTPSTQKSTIKPFSHKPLILLIPTSDDQIKTPPPGDPRGGAERVSRSGLARPPPN